ncbi:MAG TPA: bifunctional 4-hydroxy-2-oxoglutarate aldolase/2-dehydro-3-deoxy-phosphogluconate aldolase [Anaerolineaceae bacterium]
MARFQRLETYDAMLSSGLVPIFYNGDVQVAEAVVRACVAGRTRVVELTNRGDHALKVFTHLSEYLEAARSPVILGAGSIIDAPTAALFIAHGANFIVSPNFNPEVARLCNRRKIPYLPGCATVSEISNAEEMGVEIVKIFPGETIGGPAFIKALLGPMPWTRIMPTGGVDPAREDVSRWIKAGAACLGMGSNLIRKDWVSSGQFDLISEQVEKVLQYVQDARK